jgi:hypothetical protein
LRLEKHGGSARERGAEQMSRVSLTPVDDLEELRRIVRGRRTGNPSIRGRENELELAGSNPETLWKQAELYRNLLDFDLASPVPVFGRPLTLLKQLIRRIARSYIARQTSFNQYCLTLLVSANDEQSRRENLSRARLEQLEARLAELTGLVDRLSIELDSRRAEAAEAIDFERAEKLNPYL